SASDHSDDGPEAKSGAAVEQSAKQSPTDAPVQMLGVDVDAVLASEAVSRAVTELGRIGIAHDLPSAFRDQEGPTGFTDAPDFVAMENGAWRLGVVGCSAREDVVGVDCGDRLRIALARISD